MLPILIPIPQRLRILQTLTEDFSWHPCFLSLITTLKKKRVKYAERASYILIYNFLLYKTITIDWLEHKKKPTKRNRLQTNFFWCHHKWDGFFSNIIHSFQLYCFLFIWWWRGRYRVSRITRPFKQERIIVSIIRLNKKKMLSKAIFLKMLNSSQLFSLY